jgi:integrase
VLTPREVRELLLNLDSGPTSLVASLLYGTGMRLLEGLRLRVKDLEFERREVVVRQGKGSKDRVTVLPENLILPLRTQLEQAREWHGKDIAAGRAGVWLPDALAVKYPKAGQSWGWQWVFPSPTLSLDPRSGIERRHHLHEQSVQRAVAAAARRAGIAKPCSPHVLRHYSESMNMPSRPCRRGRAARGKAGSALGIFPPATLGGVTGDDDGTHIGDSIDRDGRGLVAGAGYALW